MSKKGKGKNSREKPGAVVEESNQKPDQPAAIPQGEVRQTGKTSISPGEIMVDKKVYTKELRRLQVELVKLQ